LTPGMCIDRLYRVITMTIALAIRNFIFLHAHGACIWYSATQNMHLGMLEMPYLGVRGVLVCYCSA
jgi:hypothetical protein